MSYKIKNGKLQKKSRPGEWTRLFDEDRTITAAISRPGYHSDIAIMGSRFAESVVEGVLSGKPRRCYNVECETEFSAPPAVFAVLRSTETTSVILMGICPKCAAQTDDEIFTEIRRIAADAFGVGPNKEKNHVAVQMPAFQIAYTITTPDKPRIVVAATANWPHDPMCDVANVFGVLLQDGKLPGLEFAHRGAHNCHAIVSQIYQDLRDAGLLAAFEFKTGYSGVLQGAGCPNDGIHSWVEADGWVIDASGGGMGNPILIQQAAQYYKDHQITGVGPFILLKEAA